MESIRRLSSFRRLRRLSVVFPHTPQELRGLLRVLHDLAGPRGSLDRLVVSDPQGGDMLTKNLLSSAETQKLLAPLGKLRSLSLSQHLLGLVKLGGPGLRRLYLFQEELPLSLNLPLEIAHCLKRLTGLRTLRFNLGEIEDVWRSMFYLVWNSMEPVVQARLGSSLERFALWEASRDGDGAGKRCVLSDPWWTPDQGFGNLRRFTVTRQDDVLLLAGCHKSMETLKLRVALVTPDIFPALKPFASLRRLFLQLVDDTNLFGNSPEAREETESEVHGSLLYLRLESLAIQFVGMPEQFGPRIALCLPASLRHLAVGFGDGGPMLASLFGLSDKLHDVHEGVPGTKRPSHEPGLRLRLKYDAPALQSLAFHGPPGMLLEMLTVVAQPLMLSKLAWSFCVTGEKWEEVGLGATLAEGGGLGAAEAFRRHWARLQRRIRLAWSRKLNAQHDAHAQWKRELAAAAVSVGEELEEGWWEDGAVRSSSERNQDRSAGYLAADLL